MCQHFVTLSYGDSLYTHRQESGNDTFQNMIKKFNGLENVFAGPGWVWKPYKSKDRIFLHRNYIQKYFSTPKKICFFSIEKKIEFFSAKKISEKSCPKNPKFFQVSNFGISEFRNLTLEKKSDFSIEKKTYFFRS